MPPSSEHLTRDTPDLVVFSHLRWSWVWQRPQHLISRLARTRRTWFVEEPIAGEVAAPTLVTTVSGPVRVVQLHVPFQRGHIGFDAPAAASFGDRLADAIGGPVPLVWIYTPLALGAAERLDPDIVVYDVMDDLASFRGASPHLRDAQRAALERADLVFTGGRSLHAGVTRTRTDHVHRFASGVEPDHFALARTRRRRRPRPVAGYVGVIDERLDLALLADAADELHDWELRIVGPVAKIDVADLPQRPNLIYPGPAAYEALPEVLAGFDVALMPFALNEATRSISPTKTLEYLAAGLPVVSTAVPDVVADFADIVSIAHGARELAGRCRAALVDGTSAEWERRIEPVLAAHRWDGIAAQMEALVEERRTEVRRSAA